MADLPPNHVDLEASSEGEENSHPPPKVDAKKKGKPILMKPNPHFKRQRKLTSGVWVNFNFLDEPDEQGNLVCQCKKCGKKYNADSSQGTGK